MSRRGTIRIGISGWNYSGWRGVFYPPRLPHRQELSFASATFPTIEINGTFYSLQKPCSYARWAAETPDDFVFSIKGSRYITHLRRLRSIHTALANFFASGLLQLGPKLGPFLWQFPPNFQFQPELLAEFFAMLPRDTLTASRLAAQHEDWLNGRTSYAVDVERPLRHAIEIRHESFRTPGFIRLLREHRIALVCADAVEWPLLMDLTSDFVYCRLHGSEQLYTSGYDDKALRVWAKRIAAWAAGTQTEDVILGSTTKPPRRASRDVYVYFDNDAKVRAPADALTLTRFVRTELEKLKVKPKLAVPCVTKRPI